MVYHSHPRMGDRVFTHRAVTRARTQELRQARSLSSPTRTQLSLLRELWKRRRGFLSHTVSHATIIVLLFSINALWGGGFPWALIPSSLLGVGVLTSWRMTRSRDRALLQELSSEGVSLPHSWGMLSQRYEKRGRRRSSSTNGGDALQQAKGLRGDIVRMLKKMPETRATLGSDFTELLATYVSQIEKLSLAADGVQDTLAEIDTAGLQSARTDYLQKLQNASDTRLKRSTNTLSTKSINSGRRIATFPPSVRSCRCVPLTP